MNLAAHPTEKIAADTESQTCSSGGKRTAPLFSLRLFKRFKDPLLIFRTDADSRIRNFYIQPYLSVFHLPFLDFQTDPSPCAGIFHRIIQQIYDDLLEPYFIPDNLMMFYSDIHFKMLLFFTADLTHHRVYRFHNLIKIERNLVERHFSPFNSGHLKDIVDQRQHI